MIAKKKLSGCGFYQLYFSSSWVTGVDYLVQTQ